MGEFQVVKTQEDYCREYKCGVFDLPYQITTDKSFQAMGYHRVVDHPEATAVIHALSPEMVWACMEGIDVLGVKVSCQMGMSFDGVLQPWKFNGYRGAWRLYAGDRLVKTSTLNEGYLTAQVLRQEGGKASLLIFRHVMPTSARFKMASGLLEGEAGDLLRKKVANPDIALQGSVCEYGWCPVALGLVELTWDPDFKDLPYNGGDLAESITRTSLQVAIAQSEIAR